jgi:quercetin dioxygenase-like cupin family protein
MTNERLELTPGESVEVVSADENGLVVEATYAAGGERPPAHQHPNQDEHFEVLEGTLRVELAGAVKEYAAGEGFDVPRGTVHRMSNDGLEPARVRWTTSPAGRTLDWFRELEATQRRVGDSKLKRALAFPPLLYKFRDTFRLARG